MGLNGTGCRKQAVLRLNLKYAVITGSPLGGTKFLRWASWDFQPLADEFSTSLGNCIRSSWPPYPRRWNSPMPSNDASWWIAAAPRSNSSGVSGNRDHDTSPNVARLMPGGDPFPPFTLFFGFHFGITFVPPNSGVTHSNNLFELIAYGILEQIGSPVCPTELRIEVNNKLAHHSNGAIRKSNRAIVVAPACGVIFIRGESIFRAGAGLHDLHGRASGGRVVAVINAALG